MTALDELQRQLKKASCHSVLPYKLDAPGVVCAFDLSPNNPMWEEIGIIDEQAMDKAFAKKLAETGAKVGAGGYAEWREMYRRSAIFDGSEGEPRNIHLGIDLWAPAGTEVFAPLPGRVHSFADNAGMGNYGPTIILEHALGNTPFYTLYGHLSRKSLEGLAEGMAIEGGQRIAWFGEAFENGNWAPHLHFQCMTDMLGNKGDFAGVCARSQMPYFLSICFNPNWLMGIPVLP